MTDSDIKFFDYVEQLRRAVLYVHPAERMTIDRWLTEMFDAADSGDVEAAAELAQYVKEKIIEREQEWQWEYGVDDDEDNETES